ncbi:MAG: ABC transporter substrate-binding protein [Burkholderiaceae bacterium]
MKHKTLIRSTLAAMVMGSLLSTAVADELYVPSLSYRTGPFAASGNPIANGFGDYFTMLNERDGGIGGVKVNAEECETSYNAQKGVECYEATKGKGALVYNPYSTGITLQLIQKAPVDKIPVLSMGYGLSAAAIGDKFPWTFNFPATYWGQMSAILSYIADKEGGKGLDALKGKKIGFIYLDAGYGREPIPLLEQLSKKHGFELLMVPVGAKEMQNQSSHWLTVRKEKPDWMIMWGWGAMNATAVNAAAKVRYPMDRFIGNWWAGAHADLRPVGKDGKGYQAANFSGVGKDFPAIKDIIKHVVDKGKSQVGGMDDVGTVLYNRGVVNAIYVAEAIRTAQEMSGKKNITGEDMRKGLENLNLDAARLEAIGATGLTPPIKVSCRDHSGAHPIFIQQWDGSDWKRVTKDIPIMVDVVRPMLQEAADKYVAENTGWQTQECK